MKATFSGPCPQHSGAISPPSVGDLLQHPRAQVQLRSVKIRVLGIE